MEFIADSGGFWVMKGSLQVIRWSLLTGFAHSGQPKSKEHHATLKEFWLVMTDEDRVALITNAVEAVVAIRRAL